MRACRSATVRASSAPMSMPVSFSMALRMVRRGHGGVRSISCSRNVTLMAPMVSAANTVICSTMSMTWL